MTDDLDLEHQVSFHKEALVRSLDGAGIPDAYQGDPDVHWVSYQDVRDDVKTTVLVVLVDLELGQQQPRRQRLQLQHVVMLDQLLMSEGIVRGVRPDPENQGIQDDDHEIRDVHQVDQDVDRPLPMADNLEGNQDVEGNCLVRRDPDVSVHIHSAENDHMDFPYVHEGSFGTGNLVHVSHLVLVRQMCLFLGHLVVPLHLEEFLKGQRSNKGHEKVIYVPYVGGYLTLIRRLWLYSRR